MRSSSILALLGCLFLAGCGSSSAIVPEPLPPRPITVIENDDLDAPPPARSESDDETRQRALVVFAAEQRNLLTTLTNDVPFVRTSSGMQSRVRDALFTSERELSSIERSIRALGQEDDLDRSERAARHDELKDRLRRLATRLSLIENAIRER